MTRSPRTRRSRLSSAALIAAAAALVPAAALAHGDGVLELASSTAAAGEELVVRGSDFATGESYRLVLVGALEERELDSVRPDEDGAFSITVTVPDDLREGRYRLAAVAPDGDVVDRADLAVLGAPASEADAGTPDREARAGDMPLERSRGRAEWGAVVLLVGLAGGLGARLLRR